MSLDKMFMENVRKHGDKTTRKLLSSLIIVIIIFFYVRIVYVKAMHISIEAYEDKNGIYDIEMI